MFKSLLTLTFCGLLTMTWTASMKRDKLYNEMMAMPDSCVNAPPVHNNYTLAGSHFVLEHESIPDITIYETPVKNSTRIVIAAYDISGFAYNNTRQVADILAMELNARVVMPDYFRGSVFTPYNPNPTKEEIAEFVSIRSDWEDTVYADTMAVIDYYKRTAGATSFGIFGWCWGGKMTTLASMYIDDIDVAAQVHPSGVDIADAAQVKCPMYLMPGSNDPDMIPFYDTLVENLGIFNAGHRRFDLPHGFSGGPTDFSDPEVMAAVDEVITIITNFFDPRLA